MKLTILGLVIGFLGLYFTVFPLDANRSSPSNITIIQSQPIVSERSKPREHIKPQIIPALEQAISFNNTGAYNRAYLKVSAMNANIEIRESTSGNPYSGGTISSMNTDHIIYIPKGQLLSITLSGVNTDLEISDSIADQVETNDSGMNNNISVL